MKKDEVQVTVVMKKKFKAKLVARARANKRPTSREAQDIIENALSQEA